jgi:phenylalanyl-tRNA synthetase beta chain
VAAASRASVAYREIPRFPAVSLDVALVVPEDVTAERVENVMRSAGRPLLESARLFDVYRDAPDAADEARRLPKGTKSLAFSLRYRAADRTLTDEEVRRVHDKVIDAVCSAVGGRVRA